MVVLLAITGVIGLAQHLTAGPESITVKVPNFRGQSCESATTALQESMGNFGVEATVVSNGMDPGCRSNVVLRTTPPAGAALTSSASERPTVEFQVIDRTAYDFYAKNKKMPDLIGKALVRDYESSVDMLFMIEVRDDSLVQLQSDGGFYVAAGHRITRTEPAPGQRLKMGQHMTFYTQTQRGKYVSGDTGVDEGSESGGSNGNGVNFYACVRFGPFGVCAT